MIDIAELIRRFSSNAQAIQALVTGISDEQAAWKPSPDAWCMKEVMEHVYNEERIDFRKHLREMFSSPPLAWDGIREEYVRVESCRQALDRFLVEREASIAWLKALDHPDWEVSLQAAFGPGGEEVLEFRAGDVLVSWVAHDYLHIRQMNELLFAWNERQGAPYSVRYAGGW
jgi:hypothetical protein